MDRYNGLLVSDLKTVSDLECVAQCYHRALAARRYDGLPPYLERPGPVGAPYTRKALCLILGPNYRIDTNDMSGWFWAIPVQNKAMEIPWHWYRMLDTSKQVLVVVFITSRVGVTLRAPAIHTTVQNSE